MEGERNLAPELGPSVWDRESESASREQWPGWRGLAGAALAGVGSLMLYRSMTRRRPGWPEPRQATGRGRETVVEQSEDSFPASDSPSWTPVRAVQPRGRE